jgi:hypothetical protein
LHNRKVTPLAIQRGSAMISLSIAIESFHRIPYFSRTLFSVSSSDHYRLAYELSAPHEAPLHAKSTGGFFAREGK